MVTMSNNGGKGRLTERQTRMMCRLRVHGELYVGEHQSNKRTAQSLVDRGLVVWADAYEFGDDLIFPAGASDDG